MTATVHKLPGAETHIEPHGIILSHDEIVTITGYARPADQLKTLHAMGRERARRGPNGKVILERAHFEAVVTGSYGKREPANDAPRAPLPPNRAGFRSKFGPGKAGA
jgi:hypothetical protein